MIRKTLMSISLFALLWLTGCQQSDTPSETPPLSNEVDGESVNLYINDVLVKGNHTENAKGELFIDTKSEEWLQTLFPNRETITLEDISADYQLVKERKEKETRNYYLVVLPQTFEYATPEEEGIQTWVDANLYPKGWYIVVKGDGLERMVTEVIPKEDYQKEKDKDGYWMYTWNNDVLGGWPLPPVHHVEIVDFPDGHQNLEEDHYSIEFFFE